MSLMRLLTQTVTIRRATGTTTDTEGNTARTFTDTDWPGRVEQTDSTEVSAERTNVTSDWRVFLPPTVVIGPHDRVVADGRTFEVVGAPAFPRTPRGVSHCEARLRYVEG